MIINVDKMLITSEETGASLERAATVGGGFTTGPVYLTVDFFPVKILLT